MGIFMDVVCRSLVVTKSDDRAYSDRMYVGRGRYYWRVYPYSKEMERLRRGLRPEGHPMENAKWPHVESEDFAKALKFLAMGSVRRSIQGIGAF